MNDARPLPRMADYTSHVRRHWRRIAALSLVGALAGGTLFFLIPHRYYATSRVAVSPQMSYVSLSSTQERQPLVTLDTTAELLHTDEAMDRVADAMGVDRVEVEESMRVSARPLSRVLVVQIRADDPGAARRGVVAATDSMLDLQAHTFALADERVSLLKRRAATLERKAQESITSGDPSQSLFDTVRVLRTRLDRAVDTNNTKSRVLVQARVVEYRPGQFEVFVASGLTLGAALALLWAGRIAPASTPRRGIRRAAR